MSTQTIFLFAIGVFTLMVVGMILTMIEFNRISAEPSLRKGDGDGNEAPIDYPTEPDHAAHANVEIAAVRERKQA